METTAKYTLSNRPIDEMPEKVTEFLTGLKTERRNLLRIRLSIEDILLSRQDKFSDESEVSFNIGKRFGRPFIRLEIA